MKSEPIELGHVSMRPVRGRLELGAAFERGPAEPTLCPGRSIGPAALEQALRTLHVGS